MLKFYLRNTLLSPALLVGILGLLLAMLVGTDLDPDLTYSYKYAVTLGITPFFIPVATVLPICFLQRQMDTGNIRHICLVRSSRRSFSGSALLSAVLSGMGVMLGAFLLFTAFTALCYLWHPYGPPYFGNSGLVEPGDFYPMLYSISPVLEYVVLGGIFVLNGMIWPAISLLCFSFTTNQYMALAMPFVMRTGLSFVTQVLHWTYLDPAQTLLKGYAAMFPGGGIPYLLLYDAVAVLICGILWNHSVKRRLCYG